MDRSNTQTDLTRREMALAGFSSIAACALLNADTAGEEPEANKGENRAWSLDLVSEELATRRKAVQAYSWSRHGLIAHYAAELRKRIRAENWDRSLDGPFELTLRAVRQLCIHECVPDLASILTFELDRRTFPRGLFLDPCSYYPAAVALAEINGGCVIVQMLSKIRMAEDDLTLRLSMWVLWECLGQYGTGLLSGASMLSMLLTESTDKTDKKHEQENFRKALGYIDNCQTGSLLSRGS